MPYIRSYRILLVLAIAIVLWWVIGVTPFVDAIYVPYIYPAVHYGITRITYNLPFSAGDIIYIVAVIYIINYAIRRIHTLTKIQSWISFAEKTLLTTGLLYLLFMLMWGMNYYRKPIHDRYNVNAQNHVPTDYANAAFYLAHLTDSMLAVAPSTGNYINAIATADWIKYTPHISSVRIKNALIPRALDWIGVDGYFNPFTGECQVQPLLPTIMMPFIRVHEAAHAYGVASEDDANWCAYNTGINSSYPSLIASTAFNTLLYVLHTLKQEDTAAYRVAEQRMPARVQQQLKDVRAYYKKHRSPVDMYSKHVFNAYLKMNGQKEGIAAYNNIADWAVSDLQNKGLIAHTHIFN